MEPHAEVYCLQLNFKLSKLACFIDVFFLLLLSVTVVVDVDFVVFVVDVDFVVVVVDFVVVVVDVDFVVVVRAVHCKSHTPILCFQ